MRGDQKWPPRCILRIRRDLDTPFPKTLVVFLAGVLHDFPLRMQSPSANAVPWLGIGLGIVYRDHVIDVVPIGALDTVDGVQLIAVRVTDGIDARAPVESDGIDHQRVAFPDRKSTRLNSSH